MLSPPATTRICNVCVWEHFAVRQTSNGGEERFEAVPSIVVNSERGVTVQLAGVLDQTKQYTCRLFWWQEATTVRDTPTKKREVSEVPPNNPQTFAENRVNLHFRGPHDALKVRFLDFRQAFLVQLRHICTNETRPSQASQLYGGNWPVNRLPRGE
jgi:hypothetical protein